MNVDQLTIGEAKSIAAMLSGVGAKPCPFLPGSSYLIRTVTHYWLGRVREVCGDFLVMDDSAWIADTGRYHKANTVEDLGEIEPAGDGVALGLGAIVDAKPWKAELAKEPK